MKTEWFRGLDPSKKQDQINGLVSNPYLKQLREILRAREQEYLTKMVSTPDGVSWPFAQAHLNGKLSDIRETLSLLDFDPKE